MNILLAGATGYLGTYITDRLQSQLFNYKVIVRNPDTLIKKGIDPTRIIKAELTNPTTLENCCEEIDAVISTVGITRQKEGLTYMDVDYQANLNLLNEALKSGVKKFIYVSVLNGKRLRHLKICDAKERFVEKLEESGIEYCVIRPNGFFSDLSDFYNMAKKGKVYLFGDGEFKSNPIHGKDLAEFCLKAIGRSEKELEVGGPQTVTHNEMAEMAFEVVGNTPKIIHIPNCVRWLILKTVRLLTCSKVYGPIEFFMTVMAMDMIAPEYGKHTLKQHFEHLQNESEKR
ncbi:MAG: SDR family oxidoreductase [Pseudomonadota bacterium]|nr:SDR family oxidoreductase [Pseudomonadota bacterium]